MVGKREEQNQWDRYWAYGNIHSFSQVSAGNYKGAVAEFWKSLFRDLDEGSRILDVATGNGAIALLAIEESDRMAAGFEIFAVDMAAIDPVHQVKDPSLSSGLARISFQGRVSCESLPFENESMNMVCSQFGIEYSDLARSIPEAARVLKRGGGFAAIMHHRDSVLVEATREELHQLDFVMDEVKLYLRARNMLRAMAEAAPGREGGGLRTSPKVRKKHQSLQEALSQIQRAAQASANPAMLLGPGRYIREILSKVGETAPAELLGWLEEALLRVTANRRRLSDMSASAKGSEDLRSIEGLLAGSGLSGIRCEVFRMEEGGILGWSVHARKE